MQTCDFVQRKGKCADSCRLWNVSCLRQDRWSLAHASAEILIILGCIGLIYVALITL